MDLLSDSLKKLYPKFLFSALGGAVISSIYSVVDSVMVGQYEGPLGAAALAVVMPMYTIIFSLGLLFGMGGSVCMSVERGKGDLRRGNFFFTVSLVCCLAATALVFVLLSVFGRPLLVFFGGEGETLLLCEKYFGVLKLGLPLFTIGQFLSCFVRNDNNPILATASVLAGGVFNIVGDYLLIFVFDLGMRGAAIATVLGQLLSLLVLCGHFVFRRGKLALRFERGFFPAAGKAVLAGLSSFIADFSVGVLCVLFNNRVMHYLGRDALAVYGVAVNIFLLVQSLSYGVGQACQPIVSENFGAGNGERVKKVFFLSAAVSLGLGIFSFLLAECFPLVLARAFMKTTPAVEAIAPKILRQYCLCFLLMPFNVFLLYYFQAVLHATSAWIVALVRGALLSGLLVIVLPLLFGGQSLFFAMPLTELAVFAANLMFLFLFSRKDRNRAKET